MDTPAGPGDVHRATGIDGLPPDGDWLGTPFVRLERDGPVATCVVDRPEARNALTAVMYFAIRVALDVVHRDPDLAGLVITGTGDVFIPGGDLGQAHAGDARDRAVRWDELVGRLGMDCTPFEAVRNARKPVVCAVNGICQGGGLMIAMLADVSVASERATFRAPELLRGIADTYYAQVLPRQIGPARARDMLLTGRRVTAAEAEAWGLVSRVVPHDGLAAAAREALVQCTWTAPDARAHGKRIINDWYGRPDRMTMDASLDGPEALEGWLAFSERRSPSWIPAALRPPGRL